MSKYITVLSSFIIMLCLGGVYAWSIIAPELINNYDLTATQTQLVFGFLIAVFPATMIFAGRMEPRWGSKNLAIISAILFSTGYLIAGYSNGNFLLILLGIGVIGGIGTGFGYLASLTSPVKWFPERKGLMTGIAAAGFGLAATILSFFIEKLLLMGFDVLQIFKLIALIYGSIIFIFAQFIKNKTVVHTHSVANLSEFIKTSKFYKLFFSIFFGTFAGLLVIGSLKPIGASFSIDNHSLVVAVSFFAIANFAGRISWGLLSDKIGAGLSIFLALGFQALSIYLMATLPMSNHLFLALSAAIGFGFGGNFVLFAKETAHFYGINNLGTVYPYVFLGNSLGGIFGPMLGGALFETFKNYEIAMLVAAAVSLAGALVFLINHFAEKRIKS